jgi:alpha-D-ribose 1-methylphosphonate 5-triphosphate synthase subunit PhnL
MNRLLEVKNLSKQFTLHTQNKKQIEALTDVNFTIDKGEIVGLTGKSGSGKSSLIKAIYRTYLVTDGEIIYNSLKYGPIDMCRANDHQIIYLRRNEINYCSQFLRVIPRVSAADVVAEPILLTEESKEIAKNKACDLLDKLNLPQELWDTFPSTFSGGEQQRINVARSIIAKPRFLLIDEPTASLDQKTKDVVIDLLLELKKIGTSILCITHDEYTLSRIADKCIHLKHGAIYEEEPEELSI